MTLDLTGRLPALLPPEAEVLGERVFCDDELGLICTPIEHLPDAPVLARINARNEAVLRGLSMLEEHDQTSSDDGERAEFHRLEGKLDLALELIAALVRDRQGAAPVVPVRFNARGLCWESPDPVEAGALVAVECFVLPPWPLPITMHARIVHVDRIGETHRACGRIEGLSDGVREWLAKLVFRRHRRTIAQRRRLAARDGGH